MGEAGRSSERHEKKSKKLRSTGKSGENGCKRRSGRCEKSMKKKTLVNYIIGRNGWKNISVLPSVSPGLPGICERNYQDIQDEVVYGHEPRKADVRIGASEMRNTVINP